MSCLVSPTFAQLVDSLHVIRLWANCADDGATAVVAGRRVLGVQLCEPFYASATGVQVIERVGHGGELSSGR